MVARNSDVPDEKRIEFRAGINLGDIIIDGDDIHGDGVNIAARLEGIAEPGGIFISESSYQQVRDKLAIEFEDMGSSAQGIARPVRVYVYRLRDRAKGKAGARPTGQALDRGLPFENLSADPSRISLTAWSRNIITALSHQVVYTRQQRLHLQGKPSISTGWTLGVRYVEGSVRGPGAAYASPAS
jgi:adenylate cyclase